MIGSLISVIEVQLHMTEAFFPRSQLVQSVINLSTHFESVDTSTYIYIGMEKKLAAREPARARSGSARLGAAREPGTRRAGSRAEPPMDHLSIVM